MNESTIKDYEISSEAIIPPPQYGSRASGELQQAILRLVSVGDSFVTSRTSQGVLLKARVMGMEVLTRTLNPGERDPKKRKLRVWRTDGLPYEEVNRIIENRKKGIAPPTPKPLNPMTDEQRRALKGRK